MKKLECTIFNKMEGSISLPGPAGYRADLAVIPAGEKRVFQFNEYEKDYILAPYTQIIYHLDRSAKLTYRKGFKFPKCPDKMFSCIFLNERSSSNLESVHVDRLGFLKLFLGIPEIRFLDVDSYYVEYSEYII